MNFRGIPDEDYPVGGSDGEPEPRMIASLYPTWLQGRDKEQGYMDMTKYRFMVEELDEIRAIWQGIKE